MGRNRIFLRAILVGAISLLSSRVLAQALPKTTLSPTQKAAHAMDRLAFGARPGEIEALAKTGDKGIRDWIELQLNPEQIPDPFTEARLEQLPSLKLSSAELLAQYPKPNEVAEKMGINPDKFKADENLRKEVREKIGETHLPEWIVEELRAQKIIRAIESKRQLQEVLTDFWFNHFNVDSRKNDIKFLMTSYERDVIRPHLFGKFIDLLRATAHSPAMLHYLDNSQSQSAMFYPPMKIDKDGKSFQPPPKPRDKGLNENYAREILELHTLGVDGGYTQKDVTELARILTGWGVAHGKDDPEFEFNDKVHDRGEKTFLGRTFPGGRDIEEGDEALLLIARHPSTAKFISFELARTFVSDHPPQALVNRMSARFLKTDGDLRAVYRELFFSPEFWAKANYRAKIKTPFQLVVSTIRALGGEAEVKSEIPKLMQRMGEELYACLPPTGYKDTSDAWVNSGAMITRLNAALQLSSNSLPGVYTQLPRFDRPPKSINAVIEQTVARLLHEPLSQETLKVIDRELEDDQVLMGGGESRPLTEAKTVGLVLGSPEFQRH